MSEAERSLEWVIKPESVAALFTKHLVGKTMFLKGSEPNPKVKLVARNPNGTIELESSTPFEVENQPVLFRVLGRYIEIHGTIIQKKSIENFTMRIDRIGVSVKDRGDVRIPVSPDDVCITNIQTSKYLIDTANAVIPTTVKVSFGEYERILKNEFEFVTIDVFGSRGTILDEIRKTGKPLFVADTSDAVSYSPQSSALLNYSKFLGQGLQKQIFDYRSKKVKSEAIVPVNYITHDRTVVPIGYLQVQSRSSKLDIQVLERLNQICEEMIEKIRQSNTVYVKEREAIINISMTGMRVRIKNRDLATYLMRQGGFTFDVLFRGQAPITVYGLLRSAARTADGNLICGVQIGGFSDDTSDRNRYQSNIRALENSFRQQQELRLRASR